MCRDGSSGHLGYTVGPLFLPPEFAIAESRSGPSAAPLRRGLGLAVCVAVLLPLLVFGPNLPHLGERALGARDSDALKHVWSQWWAWDTVASGSVPLHTTLLNHPDGGSFFSLDLANALLGGPLRGLLSPVWVYNLLLCLQLSAAFLATWSLAKTVTGRPRAALLAGLLPAASAWMLSFAVGSGVTECAFFWPLPLVLLCAWRTLERPGWTAPVAGALLWVVQAVACPTWALVAGMLLLGGTAVWLVERPWLRKPGDAFVLDAAAGRRVGLVVLLVLLAAVPLYTAVGSTVASGVYERPLSLFGTFDPRVLPETQALALSHLVVPGEAGLRVHEGADRLYTTGYLGLVPLLLGVVGARASRGARWCLGGAALFGVVSLGPVIQATGASPGPGITNPIYLLAWNVVPLFSLSMHGTDRFVAGALLCLGGAAAWGLGSLLERLPVRLRTPAAVSAAGLVLAEVLFVSPAPWPVPQTRAVPSAAARRLAETAPEGPGAVLDLPFLTVSSGRFVSEILLDQTVHGRPVPFRLEGRGLQAVAPAVRDLSLVRALHAATQGERRPLPCRERDALARLGFFAVVLHTARLEVPGAPVIASMTRCLGEPERVEDALIYRVGARTPTP